MVSDMIMCSGQVAVALAKSTDLSGGTSTGEAAEQFARKLMDAWGVGDAQCNDGIVLFLSKEPRQVTSPHSILHDSLRAHCCQPKYHSAN